MNTQYTKQQNKQLTFNPTQIPKPQTSQAYLPNSFESEIIKYILDQKYLNLSQIQKRFTKTKNMDQLLTKLITHEFLKSKDQKLNPQSLITTTQKSFHHLQCIFPGLALAKPIKSVWAPRVNHDLLLNELRIRFEELKFIQKWYSEQMLLESVHMKKTFTDMPDAICKKMDGKCYFLELEISAKAQSKYLERIDLYSRVLEQEEIKSQSIEGVIFICTDEKVLETIKSKFPKDDNRFSALHISRYLPHWVNGVKHAKCETEVTPRLADRTKSQRLEVEVSGRQADSVKSQRDVTEVSSDRQNSKSKTLKYGNKNK